MASSRALAGDGVGEVEYPASVFEVRKKRPSGKHILEVEGVTKSYGKTPAVKKFTTSVTRG
jgi:ATPase subunit of ABC transporter with duplicated ATPase domains